MKPNPQRPNRRKKSKRKPPPISNLEQLLDQLQIREWDYLIVGDGSGTTWEKECGWGSVLIDRAFHRKYFHGGFSHGSNVIAEMMAYVQPLLWLVQRKRKVRPQGTQVHIITDCEYVRNSGQDVGARKKHRELWGLLDSFRRQGLYIHYHWLRRDTVGLNVLSHHLAQASRRSQQKLLDSALSQTGTDSVYDVTPSTG